MSISESPVALPRIAAFERFGFGLFLHYGLYSLLEKGEKSMFFYNIPNSEYEKLMENFTAERFSGRDIARLAKKCGMRYACLTARHHDGFSLYDTQGLNTYDAPHSAAKRDLISDFTEGCRAEGITPFLYHTTLDWHDARFKSDFPAYREYLMESVELLCKNYGKIGGFWFDGNWSRQDVDWEEDKLYKMIRSYQPDAILVNNSGQGARGAFGADELDSVTFENGRPHPMDRRGMQKYIAAEMCETMSDYWGYAKEDVNYKSSAALIESLCSCRKVGANYLLNVGPKGDGSIPFAQAALLDEIAVWRESSRAPLYDVKPCGITTEGKSFGLSENGTTYLYVYGLKRADADGVNGESGNGVRTFFGVKEKVEKITWLDSGETLSFKQEGDKLDVICTGYSYGKSLVVRVAKIN